MTMLISCKCGWRTEEDVETKIEAEVLADRHEQAGWRHGYQHDTNLVEVTR